jgi:HD-GYP domain-containing protein (c-di-GMP phosphodiesterase class II)
MHPSIGANILSGIKQMRDIIPGVLYHHERVDGKGYPNGLRGDEIPLMGKIIGMADCFDAMTSERTYHNALGVDDAVREIEERLGSQFDEKVGTVFIKSDVYHLWDLMQDGDMKTYGADDFSQYGAVAVGTLIR